MTTARLGLYAKLMERAAMGRSNVLLITIAQRIMSAMGKANVFLAKQLSVGMIKRFLVALRPIVTFTVEFAKTIFAWLVPLILNAKRAMFVRLEHVPILTHLAVAVTVVAVACHQVVARQLTTAQKDRVAYLVLPVAFA